MKPQAKAVHVSRHTSRILEVTIRDDIDRSKAMEEARAFGSVGSHPSPRSFFLTIDPIYDAETAKSFLEQKIESMAVVWQDEVVKEYNLLFPEHTGWISFNQNRTVLTLPIEGVTDVRKFFQHALDLIHKGYHVVPNFAGISVSWEE